MTYPVRNATESPEKLNSSVPRNATDSLEKPDSCVPGSATDSSEKPDSSVPGNATYSPEKLDSSVPENATYSPEKLDSSVPENATDSPEKLDSSVPENATYSPEKLDSSVPENDTDPPEKLDSSVPGNAKDSPEKVDSSVLWNATDSSEKPDSSVPWNAIYSPEKLNSNVPVNATDSPEKLESCVPGNAKDFPEKPDSSVPWNATESPEKPDSCVPGNATDPPEELDSRVPGNATDFPEKRDSFIHHDFVGDDDEFSFSDSNDSDYSPSEDTDQGASDTDDNAVHSLLHLKDSSNPPDYVSDSNDSERSIVVPISIPLETITVQKTNSEKGKQKWDKKHACKFCGKLYPKLARHLETMHKNEVIVAKALSLPKNSAERKEIWKTIRNEGDWDHNFNVLKNGTGTLIPKYREQKTRAHSEFIPCSGCKGLYSKTSLSDHFKTCVSKQTDKKNQGVKEGRFLLPIPEHINGGFYKDVLLSMSQDDIYMYIYRDPLILKFGKRLYENKDIQEHTSNHISCRMRELGRLIGEAKKTPEWGIQKIEDCFSPEKFNNVVSCVKSLAGFSEDTHMYATPSLALKIGYSLQRCARIYRSDGIIESDITKQENI
ncbi:uncharacterized protein LOC128161127 [Crassostrea angulata]|uniref:uncharacterized protein LOC128161127 n=1 Tax=Magallana angulata TaxID=2784310 RepID=UPI0022B15FCB|nr:uncharacterized protein LOC128161127 [Crassostrea angulata]